MNNEPLQLVVAVAVAPRVALRSVCRARAQHRISDSSTNFWQENPFKLLAAVGVPTVLYIFKGKQGQEHLALQMKVMHTRVFGQFAVITMLLTLMGCKEELGLGIPHG